MIARWIRVIPLLALVFLAGCARFKGSKTIDMAPFAENTNTMVGEIQRVNRPPTWTYLKPYRDRPSVVSVREAAAPVRQLLAGIALYSSQIVALSESPHSESRKSQELARYLEEVVRPGIESGETADVGITVAQLDTILGRVRSSTEFLAALQEAQPLVHSATVYGGKLFDRLETSVNTAIVDVDAQIEERFAPLRRNLSNMQDVHTRIVSNFAQLYHARFGDESELTELTKSNPGMAEMLPKGRKATTKDLDAMEAKLSTQLDQVENVRNQLVPEFELYRAHQAELEDLRTQTQEVIRLGRSTLALWSRSHRNLAAGIAVPPAIDVVGLFRSTAQSAVGKMPGF
jgi:hypothetical protein